MLAKGSSTELHLQPPILSFINLILLLCFFTHEGKRRVKSERLGLLLDFRAAESHGGCASPAQGSLTKTWATGLLSQ